MTVDLTRDYIDDLQNKGHRMVDDYSEFDVMGKSMIVSGSNESFMHNYKFMVFNSSSPLFTKEIKDLFDKCNLSIIPHYLNKAQNDFFTNDMTKTSRGQPVMIDFNSAIQNCTNTLDCFNIKLPKLTVTAKKMTDEN
eukprot:14702901-Ditylum_brightwellii.AAC.1